MQPPKPKPRFRQLPAATQEKLVRPRVGKGRYLAHAAHEGHFGPPDKCATKMCIVAVTAREKNKKLTMSGFLLTPKSSGEGYDQFPLPILTDRGEEVRRLLFVNLDDDPSDELIIVMNVMPNPNTVKRSNVALDWAGDKFVRLPLIEKKIGSLETVDKVLKAVAKKPPQSANPATSP